MSSAGRRRKADYWAYYHAQCKKLAPRTIDWDSHAYESVLGLLMYDHPHKTEVECIIALANMGLFAPLTGPRESR